MTPEENMRETRRINILRVAAEQGFFTLVSIAKKIGREPGNVSQAMYESNSGKQKLALNPEAISTFATGFGVPPEEFIKPVDSALINKPWRVILSHFRGQQPKPTLSIDQANAGLLEEIKRVVEHMGRLEDRLGQLTEDLNKVKGAIRKSEGDGQPPLQPGKRGGVVSQN